MPHQSKKRIDMKKFILTTILSVFAMLAFAAGEAEIKFDKTSHNFGSFPPIWLSRCGTRNVLSFQKRSDNPRGES